MHAPDVDALIAEAVGSIAETNCDDLLDRIDDAVAAISDPSDRGRLLSAKAVAGQDLHSLEETLVILLEALPLLAQGDDVAPLLNAMTHASGTSLELGNTGQGIDLAVEALILLGETDPESVPPGAGSNLSKIFTEFGAYEIACELAEQSVANAQRAGLTVGLAISGNNLVHAAILWHRHAHTSSPQANAALDLAVEVAETIAGVATPPMRHFMSRVAQAEVSIERGDLDDARQHIDDVRLHVSDNDTSTLAVTCALAHGKLLRREGRLAEAITQFDRAAKTGAPDHAQMMSLLAERAETAAELGDLATALADYRQMAETLQDRLPDQVGHLVQQVRRRAEAERHRMELEHEADALVAQVRSDDLTGVSSRGWFEVRVDQLMKSGRSVAVLMLDLDGFKTINDSFGHPVGDEVLRRVGRVLKANQRTADLVARYGGEEFVIIPQDSSIDGAMHLAERLRAAIEREPWSENQDELRVTTSIGVACGPAALLRDTLCRADKALYEAKAAGRNVVIAAR